MQLKTFLEISFQKGDASRTESLVNASSDCFFDAIRQSWSILNKTLVQFQDEMLQFKTS